MPHPQLGDRYAFAALACAVATLSAISSVRASDPAGVIPKTYALEDYWPILDSVELTYFRESNRDDNRITVRHTIAGPLRSGAYDVYDLVYRRASGAELEMHSMNWFNGHLILAEYQGRGRSYRIYTDAVELMPAQLAEGAQDLPVGNGGIFYAEDSAGTDTVTITNYGMETVEVKAGTYDALHVRVHRDWKKTENGIFGYDIEDFWLVFGIGPVRIYRSMNVYDPFYKQWFLDWTDDQLSVAPIITDLSRSMPPVMDQSSPAHGVKAYSSRNYVNGYGAGAAWAMGYYYKTFQEAMQREELTGATADNPTTDPARIASPYFLYHNGADHIHFAGELLTGWGAPPLSDYGSYDAVTTDAALSAAAPFQALGFRSFFANVPKVNPAGQFTSKFDNDINALRSWLKPPRNAEGEQPPGDCFVIGIPVFQSLLNYRNGVYSIENTADEIFRGYHAVCVVGANDIIRAFRIVNSWGEGWGSGGYGWLSYDYVQFYAIEAWWMKDARGFRLKPGAPQDDSGNTQVRYTRDYKITYKPKSQGRIAVTEAGIQILKGADGDTLNIKRLSDVLFGEEIPSIQSQAGFAKLYTDAPVIDLGLGGTLKNLTAKGCHVETVVAKSLMSVNMSPVPNSTWQFLSKQTGPHPNGYLAQTGRWLNRYADTTIVDTAVTATQALGVPFSPAGPAARSQSADMAAASAPAAQISLSGARLKDLAGEGDVTLCLSTKKTKIKGNPPYYSLAHVGQGTGLDVLGRLNALVTGGAIDIPEVAAYGIQKLEAKGMAWSSSLKTHPDKDKISIKDYFAGDIRLSRLSSEADIQLVRATGGDLRFSALTARQAIHKLRAKHVKVIHADSSTEYRGGRIGDADHPTSSVVIAGYGEEANPNWAGVNLVFGTLGVAASLIAGSDATGLPNYLGSIATIKVAADVVPKIVPTPPVIRGEAFVQQGWIISFVNDDPPPDQFIVHYPSGMLQP